MSSHRLGAIVPAAIATLALAGFTPATSAAALQTKPGSSATAAAISDAAFSQAAPSGSTSPLPTADGSEEELRFQVERKELQAAALRQRAEDVLARKGPVDLALAQLTRAALLDPRPAETWTALERSAERLRAEPRTARSRWTAWSERSLRWTSAALGRVRTHATTTVLPWWRANRARPEVWGTALGLSLLVALTTALLVRRRRPSSLAAPAPPAPLADEPVRALRGGSGQGGTPYAGRRSADEAALIAYLESRRPEPGESAAPGILVRA